MLLVAAATLAIFQSNIGRFDLGPVSFDLSVEFKWELTVKDPEVVIDLDTLAIRAQKRNGQWSTGIFPFKGYGQLPLSQASQKVTLQIWPPEWADSVKMLVDYTCKRRDYLWHQRVKVIDIKTPGEGPQADSSGLRRMIMIPNETTPPELRDMQGKEVAAAALAYRPLRIKSHEIGNGRFTYQLESEDRKDVVVYKGSRDILEHPWFDIIARESWSLADKPVFVKGRFVDAATTDGTIQTHFDTQYNPIMVQKVYLLGRPRRVAVSARDFLSDADHLSLQPVLTILTPANGEFAKNGFVATGSAAGKKVEGASQEARDPKNYSIATSMMPTLEDWHSVFSTTGPEVDFKGDEKFLPVLKDGGPVAKGMSPEQVLWIMGPPIKKEGSPEAKWVWTYMSTAPGHSVTFTSGRVSEVFIGRLP